MMDEEEFKEFTSKLKNGESVNLLRIVVLSKPVGYFVIDPSETIDFVAEKKLRIFEVSPEFEGRYLPDETLFPLKRRTENYLVGGIEVKKKEDEIIIRNCDGRLS